MRTHRIKEKKKTCVDTEMNGGPMMIKTYINQKFFVQELEVQSLESRVQILKIL